jgi:uncharacterized protein (UPF0332 family)
VPHVTAFAHRDGWGLVFEFGRGGHSNRFEILRLAEAFYTAAELAIESGLLAPFLDLAYSTCELLAKAELLSQRPTVELVLNSKKHAGVASAYHQWADLENTDRRFARLLGQLGNHRSAARYGARPLAIDLVSAAEIRSLLLEMRNYVRRQVESNPGAGEPNVFYAYAAREMRAGEVVGTDDFTIIRPR